MTNMDDIDVNGEESRATQPSHTPTTTSATNESCNNCGRERNAPAPAEPPKNILVVCAGCQKPVYDKYYMKVDERSWHEACVQCSVCRRPLIQSCYTKNCKLYCQQDYKQLLKCRRCFKVISCNELILRAAGHTYHATCFACDICRHQLQSGDQYLLDDSTNQIYCKVCHDQGEEAMSVQFPQDEESGSDSERSDDDVFSQHGLHIPGLGRMPPYVQTGGLSHPHSLMRAKTGSKSSSSLSIMTSSADGKRVKRPRTILTTNQRRKFKASFEVSQKPCRKVRETLAAETGLSPRVVQVWFQNQRAKMKKIARRQQGDGNGTGKAGNRTRRKKTAESDSDNEISSPDGSYASIPTPHQNSLYHDTYRSPGSIQTSPTTSASDTNPFFSVPHPTHEVSDLPCDEFDSTFLPHDTTSDGFLTQTNTVTSSGQTPSLTLDTRLHVEMTETMNDFSGSMNAFCSESELLTATTPLDSFPQFSAPQTLTPFPTQTADGNPIDKLMFMQNNFFRT